MAPRDGLHRQVTRPTVCAGDAILWCCEQTGLGNKTRLGLVKIWHLIRGI